jgi:hypothetical protein
VVCPAWALEASSLLEGPAVLVVQGRCRVWRAAVPARAALQAWQVVHPVDPADRVDLAAPEAQGKIMGRRTSILRKGP